MAEESKGLEWAYSLSRRRIKHMEEILKKVEWGNNGFCPVLR